MRDAGASRWRLLSTEDRQVFILLTLQLVKARLLRLTLSIWLVLQQSSSSFQLKLISTAARSLRPCVQYRCLARLCSWLNGLAYLVAYTTANQKGRDDEITP